MASNKTAFNHAVIMKEFKKCEEYIFKNSEPVKSHLKVLLEPAFIYIFFVFLKDKNQDSIDKFIAMNAKWLILLDGFTQNLKDLIQFKTIDDAKKHHYFGRYLSVPMKVKVPVRSLCYFVKLLQMRGYSYMPKLFLKVSKAEPQNIPNCHAIPPTLMEKKAELEDPAQSDFQTKPSTNQIFENPTSSSVDNLDVTNNVGDGIIPSCSKYPTNSSIMIGETVDFENKESSQPNFQMKGSTSQLFENLGTNFSVENMDVTNNIGDETITSCSKYPINSSNMIGEKVDFEIKESSQPNFQMKGSTNHTFVHPGTSFAVDNMDITNNNADQNISKCFELAGTSSSNGAVFSRKSTEKPSMGSIFSITGVNKNENSFPSTAASFYKGTRSSLKNTNVENDVYIVNFFHFVIDCNESVVNCADINQDDTIIACGLSNSEIFLTSLDLDIITQQGTFPRNEVSLENCDTNKSNYVGQYKHTYTTWKRTLKGHNKEITGLAFVPGLLMSCSDDTTAVAWRLSDSTKISTYRHHEDQINDIVVSDNGAYFATASLDCTANVWNFERRSPLLNFFHPNEVKCLKFDPASKFLATVSGDKTIQLWTMEDKSSIWTIPEKEGIYVNCITISPDGKYIAYGDEMGCVKIWDLSSRQLYSKGEIHLGPIYNITYKPNSSLLSTCSGDRYIRVWNAKRSSLPSAPVERIPWNHKKISKSIASTSYPFYTRFCRDNFLTIVSSAQKPDEIGSKVHENETKVIEVGSKEEPEAAEVKKADLVDFKARPVGSRAPVADSKAFEADSKACNRDFKAC